MEAPFRDRQSRGKAAGYLACAAPLCAVGFWLAFSFDNNVAIGTGGAMALFFGYHALYFILVLFRPSEMIISEQGVRIEHGRGGPAWPWETIDRALVVKANWFNVVKLAMKDGKIWGVHSCWTLAPHDLTAEINRWRQRYGVKETLPTHEAPAAESVSAG